MFLESMNNNSGRNGRKNNQSNMWKRGGKPGKTIPRQLWEDAGESHISTHNTQNCSMHRSPEVVTCQTLTARSSTSRPILEMPSLGDMTRSRGHPSGCWQGSPYNEANIQQEHPYFEAFNQHFSASHSKDNQGPSDIQGKPQRKDRKQNK